MRRLTLAALSAALILTACSDRESPTEPTIPQPEEHLGGTCQVERFPLIQIVPLIRDVFPVGRLRLEALARAGAIKLFWDTCHPEAARRVAVSFIQWMNGNVDANRLPGATPEEVQALTLAILDGVGVSVDAPTSAGDIGVGIYDGEEAVFTTASKVALTEIEADAFVDGEPRLIVVQRLDDASNPLNFDGDQFEPFFDYDATKLTGPPSNAHKILADGKKALIAFCMLPEVGFTYPEKPSARIGHNPVEGADGFPFEILDGEDYVDLFPNEGDPEYDHLTAIREALECENLNPTLSFTGFNQTIPGFAGEAWRSTGKLARAIFLPQPLFATAVGFGGPIGGKTTSLSPFGVVEVAPISFGSDPTWSGSQKVCLNLSNPANCPAGATLYMYDGGGWGADLSTIPGAFWIWSAGVTSTTSPAYPAEFSFSKSFNLSGLPLTGNISVAADDFAQVVVNDVVVGTIGSTTNPESAGSAQNLLTPFDLGPFLHAGTNTITVRGANGNFGCGPESNEYNCNPAGVVFGGWLGRAPVIIE